MEYRYRIVDGDHILIAWHAERKMKRLDRHYIKHTKHGYLKADDKDEAVGEVSKIVWSDGTESEVVDGIIVDKDEVNELIGSCAV